MKIYRRVFLEGMLLIHGEPKNKNKNRLSLITSLYQEQGLTQAEIAQKLNVCQVTISRDIKLLGLEKKKRFRQEEELQRRQARYQKFRYCKNCKWIPIAKVISKKCNGIDYSYCPNCGTKMRKNAKKSELNHKRKEVKRL